ncbi:PH domain-containing protein [Cellulomonas composti]|uniref:Low molecular weight protein antigen 6 PH domain-containing protein n=1 Tax=Cellulomonas composti TaxID=266130 RepID=A0A511JA58_9CELL|nr:PH domain-containing protein [Cellulomonas composti]GEL94881.1 hypothetical protein CCO02nite_15390 [Cellulomonas composti]
MPTDDETWTYRPRSAVPITIGGWLVVAGFTAAQAYGGGVAALGRALPLALAACLTLWLVFYRPTVALDEAGVHVVNPFTTSDIPWAALVEIRTRYACTFVTPHRVVEAFAAPGPGRHVAGRASVVDLRAVRDSAFDGMRSVSIGEIGSSSSAIVATETRRRWEHLVESGELELGVADEMPVAHGLELAAIAAVVALGSLGIVLLLLT